MDTITYEGQQLKMTYPAKLCHTTTKGDFFCAIAENHSGCEYLILWDIINPEAQEEENMCDWDNYKISRC